MRNKLFSALSLAALVTLGSAAFNSVSAQAAQAGAGTGNPRRAAAAERRKEMRDHLKGLTPEQRQQELAKAKAARAEHHANATQAQKDWASAARAESKTIHDGVKAGTLTRETAAAQLKAWRAAHPKPASGQD